MTTTGHSDAVCVVILNWKRGADTLACIECVNRLDSPVLATIVVDNGSGDDSAALIRSHHPHVTLIESPTNLGFGGGNNLGIEEALRRGADHVWVINNDVTFAPSTLTHLLAASELARADAVGPWMFDAAGSKSVFCRNAAPLAYLTSRSMQPYPVLHWWPTFEVAGAAVLLSRRLLLARKASVGHYLDSDVFLYCEELELALWNDRNGYRAITARDAKVCHQIGASTARLHDSTRRYYLIRNRISVLRRGLGDAHAALPVALFIALTLLRMLLRPQSMTADTRAIVAGLRGATGRFSPAQDH